jgi:hypothetical protein
MRKISFITALVFISFGFIGLPEDEFTVKLKAAVEAYNKKYSAVQLQLNFNQPYYAVGDSMLFSSFYLNLVNNSPVSGKHIANIELYDHNGTKIIHEKYVIKQGAASAQLAIPTSLAPGFYNVVSYTDWMRNFDSKLFFRKTIKIVNGFEVNPSSGALPIEFFPEGGHFISGVENNVEFRIPSGLNSVTGVLKNGNDIIAQLVFSSNGIGKATFVPAPGIQYKLELQPGLSEPFTLPLPETSGVSLRLIRSEEKTGAKIFFTPDLMNNPHKFYLVLINPTTVVYSTPLEQNKISQEISLSARQLSGEISISVVSDDGKLWASRELSGVINEPKINIKLSGAEFTVRDSVQSKIRITDANGAVDGTVSVSIINKNLFGVIENPAVEESFAAQGSWLNWEMIMSKNIPEPAFKSEQYLTIEGEAYQPTNNKPVQDSTLLMFYFEKQIMGYETYVMNGKFKVPVYFDFTEPDVVFYAASRRGKDLKGVTIKLKETTLVNGNFPSFASTVSKVEDHYGSFQKKTRLINSSFNYFSKPANKEVVDPNFAIEDELGGADVVVRLKDYLVFPTMAEVVKEVLPSVDHRRIGGENMIKIYTTHKRPVNNAEPVYIVDGVITKSTDAFLSLNPADVLTIKVIKTGGKLVRLGALFGNGAILVRTKNNAGLTLNRENIFPIHGLLPATKGSKGITNVKANVPNFNSSLYWNPIMNCNASDNDLKFSTSDDIGEFEIRVSGFTSDGRPINGSETFKVVLPKQ